MHFFVAPWCFVSLHKSTSVVVFGAAPGAARQGGWRRAGRGLRRRGD